MTEAEQIMKRCQVGTRNYDEANNLHAACYGLIGKLSAQPEQEPDENALRLQFSRIRYSIGNPINLRRHDNGKFIADVEEEYQAWKQVQPEQEPVGFAVMERPWVGLTEVDILAESKHWKNPEDFMAGVYWAAGTLKEKNT